MPDDLDQVKIGKLIKELRIQHGYTQKDLAKRLKTSQSAVARMERGNQNFSTQELRKISDVLHYPLISISENATDDFEINGGKKLRGSITTNTSKNGALGVMCAALLNKAETTLHGIPNIAEIHRMIEALTSLGVQVKWIGESSLVMTPPRTISLRRVNQKSLQRMRSTIMLIGALIHHVPKFEFPHSGGCKMGKRTIAAHRYGLEPLGVKIRTTDTVHQVSTRGLHAGEITMYESSDTGVENILITAALIPKTTTVHFAPQNYMVQDVIQFLKKFGVTVEQVGPATIEITGVAEMNQPVEHHISEDPIEAMAFLSAGIVTGSKLTIKRSPIDFLRLELLKLKAMGLKYKLSKQYLSHNKHTKLVDITVYPSNLKSLDDKVHPLPYPGINVDNLPFFVPIATQAKGTTLIHDWMWENRAIYFTELNRMNATIRLADPHRAFVEGPTELQPAQIVCPPALRPSMIIMIAMLGAKGTSILRNVYAIRRGYQDIAERLNSIGADITVRTNF